MTLQQDQKFAHLCSFLGKVVDLLIIVLLTESKNKFMWVLTVTKRVLSVILLSLIKICIFIYNLKLFVMFFHNIKTEKVKGTWFFHKYGQMFKQHIPVIFLIKIYTCNYCLPKTTEGVSFKEHHLILVSVTGYTCF